MTRTGLRVVLALFAGLALGVASSSRASVPDLYNSTFPTHINLVGWDDGSGLADHAAGQFEFVIRDMWGYTMPGIMVCLEASPGLLAEYRIAQDPHDPNLHVECGAHCVWTCADYGGIARFTLIGGGRFVPPPPGQDVSFKVYFDSINTNVHVPVAAFDLNGLDGITLADLSRFSADYFAALNPTRTDYDGDHAVTLLDLSLWGAAYFGGASNRSAESYCP